MKLRVKTFAIVLLLLAAAGLAALFFWINPLAKSALESFGSSALGTELTIESVSVRPLRGSLRLKGIRLGNPEGFSSPEMLKISEVLIQIKVRSLRAQTFVIRRILIDQPELTLERNGKSDNLRTLIGQQKKPVAPVEETAPENPRRIAIEELRISHPRIRFIQTNPDEKMVTVTAESFSFLQSASSIKIEKLAIHNPPGYTSPHLLSVEKAEAMVACPHIGSFRLKGVRIESPRLLREKNVDGDNLTDFRKLIVPFFKGTGSKDSTSGEEPPPRASAYSWIPRQVIVANGKLLSLNPRLPKPMRTELAFRQLAVLPREGVARIRQLSLANPRRFSHAHILELGELQIGIDPATFGKKTLRVLEIQIISPLFAYERRLRTDNIAELQRNMLVLAGSADAPEAEELERMDGDSAGEPSSKIVIDHLLVREGKVTAKISKLPSAPITLPTIERFNLGHGEGGASYTTLTHEITGIIYQTILQSVTGIGGLAESALKGSGNLLLDAGGAVGNTALDTFQGIGNLFKDTENAPPEQK